MATTGGLPYTPEIIFMTVNRRGGSRFYFHDGKKNETKNPPPGSVVYSQFTSMDQVDFYLVPQKIDIGCAKPCQYKLIYYHP